MWVEVIYSAVDNRYNTIVVGILLDNNTSVN